jgi:antibiotic biosynthesis monooxygenase (ABM) superfamily enzyme
MIAIVWEFVVKPRSVAAFQRIYGPNGDWAALFRQYPGYEGTTLLRDAAADTRFMTIDHWKNVALFSRMRQSSQQEYSRLDGRCRALTVSEREVGVFDAVRPRTR